jgi:hypothetical protein
VHAAQLLILLKMNKKIILGLLFFIHFFFIIIYSCKQTVDLSLTRQTYISNTANVKGLQKADYYLSRLLFHKRNTSFDNDYLNLYMVSAGSKTPFSYFVANITPVEKLVFELEFNDGTKQIILPTVQSNEMGIKLKSLFNTIFRTPNELYKDILIKKLVEYQIKNLSNIKSVKAIFGVIDIPSLTNFPQKPNLDFQYLYQYNFRIK